MMECFEQGNELLGKYESRLASVHDPDEYLGAAKDAAELEKRRADVLGAYKALSELRDQGKVASIGVGAKGSVSRRPNSLKKPPNFYLDQSSKI